MPGWPEKKGKSCRRRLEIRLTERVDGVINEMYVRCKMGNRVNAVKNRLTGEQRIKISNNE